MRFVAQHSYGICHFVTIISGQGTISWILVPLAIITSVISHCGSGGIYHVPLPPWKNESSKGPKL